jgi:hypothetical protein
MVSPPIVERSLHPEIEDDGDTEEKGQTLLKGDGLHGTPPAKETLSITRYAKCNARHREKFGEHLEISWRISGVFCTRQR